MSASVVSPPVVVAVVEASQVGAARRAAALLAEQAELDTADAGRVALIATELATNLAKHARDGRLLLRMVRSPAGRGVEIVSIDRGPGMASVERCMADGYSTISSPGTGLGAIRRVASEFDVHSVQPAGTVVSLRVFPRQRPAAALRTEFVWGVVSTAINGEPVCGDSWAVFERDAHVTFVVTDGLGHGPLAAQAAAATIDVVRNAPDASPAHLLGMAHERLHGSRGAAVAIGSVARATGDVRWASIGNVAARILSRDGSRSLVSQNGTVGSHMPVPKEIDYQWPDGGLLVVHSDGLTTRWDLTKDAQLAARDPAVIAGVLHRDHARATDDATVLVGRMRAPLVAAMGANR